MERHEFIQHIKTAIGILGLNVGDAHSQECEDYTINNGSCKDCPYEKGCAVYASLIHNMLQRKMEGKDDSNEAWDQEMHYLVMLAQSGIVPTRDDFRPENWSKPSE